ncbi:hypothetical protein GCM10009827_055860 [Dactylosporangium maewongense]|uniref:Uncharacterized protein n=1 Tax=Dactylosporangium maewongense TaxID=634393 RepID=A0ABP4LSX8_9ACTN
MTRTAAAADTAGRATTKDAATRNAARVTYMMERSDMRAHFLGKTDVQQHLPGSHGIARRRCYRTCPRVIVRGAGTVCRHGRSRAAPRPHDPAGLR